MKKFILHLFLIFPLFMFAQNTSVGVEKGQFKFNLLLAPQFDYELKLTQQTTLGLQLGTELIALTNDLRGSSTIDIAPAGRLYYRYYYNFERRLRKSKNTQNNSANYFGLSSTYILADPLFTSDDELDIENESYVEMGAVYGLQRTFWNRLNLGGNMGLGYAFYVNDSQGIVPILTLHVGYIIL